MNVIFCRPELTLTAVEDAVLFFDECNTIFEKYIFSLRVIKSEAIIRQVMLEGAGSDDILIRSEERRVGKECL